MHSENRFLEDVAKLATSALGTMQGMAQEIESVVRRQIDKVIDRMDLVAREEFEVVQEMAANARAENERLAASLDDLAARLDNLEKKRAKSGK